MIHWTDNLKDILLRAKLHCENECDYDWEQQKIIMGDFHCEEKQKPK